MQFDYNSKVLENVFVRTSQPVVRGRRTEIANERKQILDFKSVFVSKLNAYTNMYADKKLIE